MLAQYIVNVVCHVFSVAWLTGKTTLLLKILPCMCVYVAFQPTSRRHLSNMEACSNYLFPYWFIFAVAAPMYILHLNQSFRRVNKRKAGYSHFDGAPIWIRGANFASSLTRLVHFRALSSLPVGTASWPVPPAESEWPPAGRVGRYQAPRNPEAAPPHTFHSQGALVCLGTCTLCRPSQTVHTHTHTLGEFVKRHKWRSRDTVWS